MLKPLLPLRLLKPLLLVSIINIVDKHKGIRE